MSYTQNAKKQCLINRYRWYHTAGDTPDKLNYDRMTLAVEGLKNVVSDLANTHLGR